MTRGTGRPGPRAAAAAARAALLAALLALLVTGCSGGSRGPAGTARPGGTPPPATARPPAGDPTAAPSPVPAPRPAERAPLPVQAAPRGSLPVGVLDLAVRNAGRSLPTRVWYPAADGGGAGARPAAGRFPLVVFSHGLGGRPADYAALLSRWAAAGFAVAAPAYPHTTAGATRFDLVDVLNQPADASAVLTAVLAAPALRGHLDPDRLGAAGHSAGGITTVGMLTTARDTRLRAGVVLAGNSIGFGTAFTGPATPVLFVHGDRDDVVSYESGRGAYAAVPWPKAFLALGGLGHTAPFVDPRATGFGSVVAATTDFLRFSLYGDAAAGRRLAGTRSVEATF